MPLIDALPNYIDPEAWAGFVEMRKLKKKPLTTNGVTRILKALERLREAGEDPNLVLNQSEDMAFTGVFPVSESYYQQRGMAPKLTRASSVVQRATDTSWAEFKH